MNDALINEITSFTLAARARLEQEADEQLQGMYGWLTDGTFVDSARYPAIQSVFEARETRRRLEQFAADEAAAGVAAPDARKRLLRETAFTWLNRLVAFRLLEERKLIKQTISGLSESNAFKFWLVEDANAAAYAEYQKGDMPKNALDEGPSQTVYRQFLLTQCANLAAEVTILFDPTNLPSRLCPRPRVLKEVVEAISAADLANAWKPGNEETVGWMYQAFNVNEETAIRASFLRNHKVTPDEIAAVTQLFTPRWVVQYLVQNTLGRLWVEMHPDSRLTTQLDYLVPVTGRQRVLKLARDISFLDPCCGSMHFGLVGFELFVEMYREELENAGKPGWPAKASVNCEEEIPGSVVAHNLFGIDLDLRAVQISALGIFQRARSLNPKCLFTAENFACANVEAITGGRLEELISATDFRNRVEERILRALAPKLRDSQNLGSLLRLERDLTTLVDAERKKLVASSQPELLLAGLTEDLFTSTRNLNVFFDQLAESIATRLDAFARDAGSKSSHTAGEAAKGLRFLRLIQRRYDVVATNPPYLDSRDYNQTHKAYLESIYPSGKRNLFAAFIHRCSELATDDGLIGMITGQSFMFIKTYEDFRNEVLDCTAVETLAHCDYHLFAARVDTAAFVLRKERDKRARKESRGVYFRLVRERDAEAKRMAFERGLTAHRNGKPHPQVFRCQQGDFDAVPGKPWTYWFPRAIREVFRSLPVLKAVAPAIHGTATYDNARFLRFWWEVGQPLICHRARSWKDFVESKLHYVPYMKGGPPIAWYGNQSYVLRLKSFGKELKQFLIQKRDTIRGEKYIFKKGVTWSLTSSKGFAARLSPGGFIFDVNGMSCFPPEEQMSSVLGVMNSRIGAFLLQGLNPTIAFQVGDIERLPLPDRSTEIETDVAAAVHVAFTRYARVEVTRDFIAPPGSLAEMQISDRKLAELERKIDADVSRLYGLNEEDLLFIRSESATPVSDAIPLGGESPTSEEQGSVEEEEPDTCAWSQYSLARAWISYAAGTVLGRYAIGEVDRLGRGEFPPLTVTAVCALIDGDGVMVADTGHPQNFVRRTMECLETMRGREAAHTLVRTSVAKTSGDPEDLLRGWFDRFTGHPNASFWKYHYQLYRNRPIYWPFQSPNKHFTVWVFHERFGPTTLFTIKQLADDQSRLIEREITTLRPLAATNRAAAKQLDALLESTDDLREFSNRIQTIANHGYTFCVDDGVLLNAAPLHSLLPSWPETKKAWQELEAGKYDWAQQAMKHWPYRVTAACKTNKSFAIAHGLA